MARNYAALPYEYLEEMEALSDAEFGRLTRALLSYSMTGEPIALCGNERFYAKRVMMQEDRYKASYKATSATNKANGALGGRPPKEPGETKNNPEKPRETQKTETETETETEINTDTLPSNDGKSNYKRAKRFAPPTLAEVQAYVSERQSPVDPQGFIDFYASKGWMVGKTPMEDWKAACRNAEHWDRWAKKGGNNGRFAEDAVAQYGHIGTVV